MKNWTCKVLRCGRRVANGEADGEKFHCYNEGYTRTIGNKLSPHESGLCFYHLNFVQMQSIQGKGGNHLSVRKEE